MIKERYQDNIIQSTIVRILKERIGKETSDNFLEILLHQKIDLFKPYHNQIQKNIEKLIEKNCIRRNGIFYEYIPN